MPLLAAAGPDAAKAFVEIGAVALALAVLARLAGRLGVTTIPFYLLAGLAVGEGGIAPLDVSADFIRLAGEIGVLLLLLYALGLGIPFLLAGVLVDRSLSVMRSVRPHMLAIERVSGALLIGMGILLVTDQLTRITSMLISTFGNGLAQ